MDMFYIGLGLGWVIGFCLSYLVHAARYRSWRSSEREQQCGTEEYVDSLIRKDKAGIPLYGLEKLVVESAQSRIHGINREEAFWARRTFVPPTIIDGAREAHDKEMDRIEAYDKEMDRIDQKNREMETEAAINRTIYGDEIRPISDGKERYIAWMGNFSERWFNRWR